MAATEVKLPDIGEGVNEGEIVRWLVKEGDTVTHDQPLVEVMTDKATVEIPSSTDGKVSKITAKEGEIVKVGGALLTIETGAGAAANAGASAGEKPQAAANAEAQPPQPKGAGQNANVPQASKAQAAPQQNQTQKAPSPQTSGSAQVQASPDGQVSISPPVAGANVLATPGTRRYAREMGVDLNTIQGTGPVGRVTRDDVAKNGGAVNANGAMPASQGQQRVRPFEMGVQGAGDERKPFRGIRRKIAENLVHSAQLIPHFTHADECDVTELVKWRTKAKEEALAQGVKLTYLPFIMKALVATCREFPNFNASIDDAASEIVIRHNFNVGFAADTAEGLLVPVVKNVDHKSILEIAHDINDLAEKARLGKLAVDDMKNGTITVTNIGSVGGVYATPIINHPQVAIIGIYKIQKKPVVIDGEITIRDMMGVTATCDHRLLDGAQAARFLNKFMKRLENPQALLLEMI